MFAYNALADNAVLCAGFLNAWMIFFRYEHEFCTEDSQSRVCMVFCFLNVRMFFRSGDGACRTAHVLGASGPLDAARQRLVHDSELLQLSTS